MKAIKSKIKEKLKFNNQLIKRQFCIGKDFPILTPIAFKESKINKNAIIIENENYFSKIIFPDYKFDLNLNVADKNYTIKNMIDDSRRNYEKEKVLTITFLEENGTLIANSVQASMLARLNIFYISINSGERIYNCVNSMFLGNHKLEREVITSDSHIDYEKIEELVFKEKIAFGAAYNLVAGKTKLGSKPVVTYSNILKDYLHIKYAVLSEFSKSIENKREKRIQKSLNFFFYLCLTQCVVLNLGTFVFFNWDFMEPITQCITFLNIIFGYYFWTLTDADYEMESMISWLRSRKYYTNPSLTHTMTQEKAEILKLLEEDKIKH